MGLFWCSSRQRFQITRHNFSIPSQGRWSNCYEALTFWFEYNKRSGAWCAHYWHRNQQYYFYKAWSPCFFDWWSALFYIERIFSADHRCFSYCSPWCSICWGRPIFFQKAKILNYFVGTILAQYSNVLLGAWGLQ